MRLFMAIVLGALLAIGGMGPVSPVSADHASQPQTP